MWACVLKSTAACRFNHIIVFQVELALSVEELLPARSRRYFIREKYTITPNVRRLGFFENFRYGLFGSKADRFDSQENISSALHPQPVSDILPPPYLVHTCMDVLFEPSQPSSLKVNSVHD